MCNWAFLNKIQNLLLTCQSSILEALKGGDKMIANLQKTAQIMDDGPSRPSDKLVVYFKGDVVPPKGFTCETRSLDAFKEIKKELKAQPYFYRNTFPDGFGKIIYLDDDETVTEEFNGEFEVDLKITKLRSIKGKIHFGASSWEIIGRPVF